jgi:hypothetical protein
MSNALRRYPAIPEPSLTPESQRESIMAMKQTLEILEGVKGSKLASVVTYQNLLDLGLITLKQVPT